jgi:uncharacterized protein (DUF736 family)
VPVIGTFARAKNGGWEGTIRTFATAMKVRFVPNDDRDTDASPNFLVLCEQSELGAAWVRRSNAGAHEFLSVQFDDPMFDRPVNAALFYGEGADRAQLVWTRKG